MVPPTVRREVFALDASLTAGPRWLVETHRAALDLDGRGTPVVVVPRFASAGRTTAASIGFAMYLMRGDCGVEVGSYQGMNEPSVQATSSHGLRDLENQYPTTSRRMAYGREVGVGAFVVLTFDGTSYVASGPPQQR